MIYRAISVGRISRVRAQATGEHFPILAPGANTSHPGAGDLAAGAEADRGNGSFSPRAGGPEVAQYIRPLNVPSPHACVGSSPGNPVCVCPLYYALYACVQFMAKDFYTATEALFHARVGGPFTFQGNYEEIHPS